MQDLPRPDHLTRAENLQRKFLAIKLKCYLGKLIFLAHWPAFVRQWSLTIISCLFNFAPQFTMFHLLQILERQAEGQYVIFEAWVWIAGLVLCLLIGSWIGIWLFWVSQSQLAIPVRAQLSALIFQKAMRRKDAKGVHQTAKKIRHSQDW
jgi:hypothetical protein